ncbi:MAG TPA: aminotransferase class IV [Candidatus Ignatzschineria merdigallinarum]|uniref:Aminotransferase class IV n=1 Tax=Candidatus Ignatzschineria merdigallinarum TaxID=2838621 RepID=A0A9D1Q6U8_9GAMM|nr:aminotransferase class IV [Candidatus Ignatzschineria merdigallinarum]
MTNLLKKSTSPFLETIKLEGGFFSALAFHQTRMDKTRAAFFDNPEALSLPLALMKAGSIPPKGLYRVRVIYSEIIESIEFIPYEKREVNSLKLIEANIDYRYKYEKRPELNTLFQQKKKCDDILITQNGFLTDTSIANIALLKEGIWYTPKSPLLKGTKRAALLHHGLIVEADIHQDDLLSYEKVRLFNAMIEFGEIEFPAKNIQ